MRLATIAYLVRDYDEAIQWFTRCLGFVVIEDTPLSASKRWVRVASSAGDVCLLLAKAEGEIQKAAIGHAAGGRVAFFLHTDDFAWAHASMLAAGVSFREEPRHEPYGTVAVFEDLYGNGWDLIAISA
jgi:catechol 2,3-dioxygenase-like lactoylglutathione lyase family enzyme